jgi:2-C-methyl-D-erythritol 2,4-cyclodiphosphate synthase
MSSPELRIGNGYDVHAFEPGDHVMLGGVRIDFSKGLKAHSDGDVVLHALCDALLGALALGDIGQHFPDTDSAYAKADSRGLLRHVYALIVSRGYALLNADITVLVEKPKLAPHIPAMRKIIATDLGVSAEVISVKATTTEKLGFIGREEGIAAEAIVLLSNYVSDK